MIAQNDPLDGLEMILDGGEIGDQGVGLAMHARGQLVEVGSSTGELDGGEMRNARRVRLAVVVVVCAAMVIV